MTLDIASTVGQHAGMSSVSSLGSELGDSATRYHKLRDFKRSLRESPLRAMFKRLADCGVPRSMAEEMTGCHYATPGEEDEQARARFYALAQLAEVYHVIAMGGIEGLLALRDLRPAIEAASLLGVLYEPPCATAARVAERAAWVRRCAAFAREKTSHPFEKPQ